MSKHPAASKHVEIKGAPAELAKLAKKLGFPYVPGDRVFRHGKKKVLAYRKV